MKRLAMHSVYACASIYWKSKRERRNCLFHIISRWCICTSSVCLFCNANYSIAIDGLVFAERQYWPIIHKANITLPWVCVCVPAGVKARWKRMRTRNEKIRLDLKYCIIFNQQSFINHTQIAICLRYFFPFRWARFAPLFNSAVAAAISLLLSMALCLCRQYSISLSIPHLFLRSFFFCFAFHQTTAAHFQ